MWIDAVCINQDDLAERASQVRFMARIYSHASCVVVWLGEEGDNSAELFATIEDIASISSRISPPSNKTDSLIGKAHFEEEDSLQKMLMSFLSRPWFYRIWVLQEVASARHITVKCGTAEISGFTFAAGIRPLYRTKPEHNSAFRNLCASTIQAMSWHSSVSTHPISASLPDHLHRARLNCVSSLGGLLDSFHLHEATDQRDKIFAILGMCSPETIGTLEPDYTKPWTTIWANAIEQILGPRTTITTWAESKQACMTVSGYILDSLVVENSTGFKMYPFLFFAKGHPLSNAESASLAAVWGEEPRCRAIQTGDILFQPIDAAQPVVIRACEGHFDIVAIALSSPLELTAQSFSGDSSIDWQELLAGLKHGQRQLTLIWDWELGESDSRHCHHRLLSPSSSGIDKHPTQQSMIYNCIRSLASVRYYCNDSTSRKSFEHLLHQSHGPDFSSSLRSDLRVLQWVYSVPSVHAWLIHTFEELRCFFWLLQQEPGTTTWPFKLNMEYVKSKDYRRYNIFDVIDFVGIQSQSFANLDEEDCFSQLFLYQYKTNDSAYPQMIPVEIVRRVLQQLAKSIVSREKSFVLSYTPEFLLEQILTHDIEESHSYTSAAIAYKALSLVSKAQNGVLALSLQFLKPLRSQPSTLFVLSDLLSMSFDDVITAYSILATIISLHPKNQPVLRLGKKGPDSSITDEILLDLADQIKDPVGGNYRFYFQDLHEHPISFVRIFVENNMDVLFKHFYSTKLFEVALAKVEDRVLSYLMSFLGVGKSHEQFGVAAGRQELLKGIATKLIKKVRKPRLSEH
jgi:hypothetical protein